jgi:hypothetical protein
LAPIATKDAQKTYSQGHFCFVDNLLITQIATTSKDVKDSNPEKGLLSL